MTLDFLGDTRVTLARADLADQRLEGLAPAERFAPSEVMVLSLIHI